MNNWLLRTDVDLAKPKCVEGIVEAGLIYTGDDKAHKWIVECYSECQPADLTGYEALAVFIRADGITVPVKGVIDGNVVTVVLDKACYCVPGMLKGVVRITDSKAGTNITVSAMGVRVSVGETERIIDPSEQVIDVAALMNELADLKELESELSSSESKRKEAEDERAQRFEEWESDIKSKASIDDSSVSSGTTWSSEMISGEIKKARPSPKIGEDNYWYVWSDEANDFVNTGVYASGTSSYNDILDKPQINSVELVGNKSARQLGLENKIANTEIESLFQ